MEHWYLLYCKRDQTLRAIEHLERQGVNCLAPRYETEKIVRHRRKKSWSRCFPIIYS
ncbi:Transcription antitermination protein RfaH (plasmid) [Providencia alcalifaciens]|nr:transcriptional activator RfaH domain protein [Providencia alcalifaciens PAL-2]CAG9435594.1 Transcription antitermination protein RfaH [Providencia alcalifaciens]CAG9435636.1 Transcription antitermination protein RfaH [Providencia alcalifaciens]CAG9436073.1 Transcription antitermination protein RfaH [Providencia alcalifaciens]CAG9436086.1 Transcription antitermination protein RfaH [Providencia alcalifaciens]